MQKRKDPKNRVLKEGEGYKMQRGKPMYYYCFRDSEEKEIISIQLILAD